MSLPAENNNRKYVNPTVEDLAGIPVCVDDEEDTTIRPRTPSVPVEARDLSHKTPTMEDLYGIMVCAGDSEEAGPQTGESA